MIKHRPYAGLMTTSRHAAKRRLGQTMLELLAATMIISIALVPALKFTSRCVTNIDAIEKSEVCLTLCTSTIEAELAKTSATWQLNNSTIDFSSDGYPDIRAQLEKTDAADQGGRPGALAVIRVVVWHDKNGNGNIDESEPNSRLSTKLARVISYENEAQLN